MQKYKELGGIGAHLDRSYIQANVDADRKNLNEELSSLKGKVLEEAINERIKEGYTKDRAIRKDAVKAVGVMLTGSHERMKEIEQDKNLFKEWKEENYRFACKEFGRENIVRFVVHRDEKTPHIHCVFVPITKEGSLSAKEYMKGKECMRGYQDRYGRVMERFGLERGLPQEVTQAVHIPTKAYYRDVNRIARESKEQTSEIRPRNVFKLTEVREDVERVLRQEKVLSHRYKQRVEQVEKNYNNIFKRNIDADLERIKQEVNLVQHVGSMGYKIDRSKSCRSYAVMEKEGDKVIINTRPNHNGHWVYMSANNVPKDRGTIVDFMVNRGYEYRDIRKLSSTHLDERVLKELSKVPKVIEDKKVQYKLSKEAMLRVEQEPGLGYLKRRKIDENSYKTYLGKYMSLGGNKATFGLYKEVDSQGEGRLCSTISYGYDRNGNSKKYFQAGLPRGLSMLKNEGKKVNEIVICESPIDALSYKQQHDHKGEAMYVSTCGSLTKGIRKDLNVVLAGARRNGQIVTLAFDKDEAGERMSKTLGTMCRESDVLYSVRSPSHGKDWNEDLKMETKKEEEQSLGITM